MGIFGRLPRRRGTPGGAEPDQRGPDDISAERPVQSRSRAWAVSRPMSLTVADSPGVAAPGFGDALATWQNPSLSGTMSHVVQRGAPSGLVVARSIAGMAAPGTLPLPSLRLPVAPPGDMTADSSEAAPSASAAWPAAATWTSSGTGAPRATVPGTPPRRSEAASRPLRQPVPGRFTTAAGRWPVQRRVAHASSVPPASAPPASAPSVPAPPASTPSVSTLSVSSGAPRTTARTDPGSAGIGVPGAAGTSVPGAASPLPITKNTPATTAPAGTGLGGTMPPAPAATGPASVPAVPTRVSTPETTAPPIRAVARYSGPSRVPERSGSAESLPGASAIPGAPVSNASAAFNDSGVPNAPAHRASSAGTASSATPASATLASATSPAPSAAPGAAVPPPVQRAIATPVNRASSAAGQARAAARPARPATLPPAPSHMPDRGQPAKTGVSPDHHGSGMPVQRHTAGPAPDPVPAAPTLAPAAPVSSPVAPAPPGAASPPESPVPSAPAPAAIPPITTSRSAAPPSAALPSAAPVSVTPPSAIPPSAIPPGRASSASASPAVGGASTARPIQRVLPGHGTSSRPGPTAEPSGAAPTPRVTAPPTPRVTAPPVQRVTKPLVGERTIRSPLAMLAGRSSSGTVPGAGTPAPVRARVSAAEPLSGRPRTPDDGGAARNLAVPSRPVGTSPGVISPAPGSPAPGGPAPGGSVPGSPAPRRTALGAPMRVQRLVAPVRPTPPSPPTLPVVSALAPRHVETRQPAVLAGDDSRNEPPTARPAASAPPSAATSPAGRTHGPVTVARSAAPGTQPMPGPGDQVVQRSSTSPLRDTVSQARDTVTERFRSSQVGQAYQSARRAETAAADRLTAASQRVVPKRLAPGPQAPAPTANNKIKPNDIDIDALMSVITRHLRTEFRIDRERFGRLRDSNR
jgi:hypothetical protein